MDTTSVATMMTRMIKRLIPPDVILFFVVITFAVENVVVVFMIQMYGRYAHFL
jgi:hypothetical protein